MKNTNPIKSEIIINIWVQAPDPSIANAVKETFLANLIAQNYYETSFDGVVEVNASEGLLTVKSLYLSLSADEQDFLEDLAGNWARANQEVEQEIKRLKALGVSFK